MAFSHVAYVLTTHAEKEERMLSRRLIRDAGNPFELLPENEFRHIYRVSKEMALYICGEIGDQLQAKRRDGLPVHIKVLTCIKLMADGNYQRGTGQDHNLCIAQTTVSKYLNQFCKVFIRRFLNRWIVFPGTAEARQVVSNGFLEKYNLPHILGTIDCTHVTIFPPPLPHGVQYLNRKGVHSLNVQLVADVNCRILSVNARYPGRVLDQFIFNNSNVKMEMRRLYDERIGEYFLLGDSGYALEPWLMTPVLNAAPNSPEERYTSWHCSVRNGIERTNGYLKGVFRILGLDRALHYAPEMSSEIIYCCCILYNMMKHFRMPMEEPAVAEVEETVTDPNREGHMLRVGQERRRNLIENHFNH